jgi:hypothetical protein
MMDANRNPVRVPSVVTADIVSEHSVTGLLGTCLVGAHDCDRNYEANCTSNSNEHAMGLYPNVDVAAQADGSAGSPRTRT